MAAKGHPRVRYCAVSADPKIAAIARAMLLTPSVAPRNAGGQHGPAFHLVALNGGLVHAPNARHLLRRRSRQAASGKKSKDSLSRVLPGAPAAGALALWGPDRYISNAFPDTPRGLVF